MQIQSVPSLIHSEPAEVVIAVNDLRFSYPDKSDVLKSIHLKIHKGDRLGIIGHNGCGKTTLFLLICGILTPIAGEIRLLDRLVHPGGFYPEIGLVCQHPDDQLFSASVWDDVAFAPQNMGLSSIEVQQRVTQALEITGMAALADRPPHHLSGGEKRMVAIAGVLAMHPQMMIYDEPTANLDLRARRRLIQFLRQSQETLVISSHDLEFILEVCDRVVLMDNGAIVADGAPRQLMGDLDLMEQYGLEVPYSLG
ncbi:MAG: energy-coupling factor ABC transporter ATP-binding protein [Elainella sp. Prado103]|jgi:cobalt/nickel transport system ATP-binding protein|nr:energy-coupling factor ABC transporter ATP-binding protein [Elainella sp. Prado103]